MATRAGRSEGAEAAASFRLDRRALDQVLNDSNGPVAKELERRALQVERRAKQLCPVDTGRLRASITHALEGRGKTLSAVVGTNVNYAPHVEFGTRYQPPRSFLRAALAAVRGVTQLPPGGR